MKSSNTSRFVNRYSIRFLLYRILCSLPIIILCMILAIPCAYLLRKLAVKQYEKDYAAEMANPSSELAGYEKSISAYEDTLAKLSVYRDTSFLMKADAYHLPSARLKYEIQGGDVQSKLNTLYVATLNSGILFQNLVGTLSPDLDSSYYEELFTIENSGNTFTLKIMADTEDNLNKLIELAKKYVDSVKTEATGQYGEHTLKAFPYQIFTEKNDSVIKLQTANANDILNTSTKLEDTRNDLKETGTTLQKPASLKRYLVIGAGFGFLIPIVLLLLYLMNTRQLQTAYDIGGNGLIKISGSNCDNDDVLLRVNIVLCESGAFWKKICASAAFGKSQGPKTALKAEIERIHLIAEKNGYEKTVAFASEELMNIKGFPLEDALKAKAVNCVCHASSSDVTQALSSADACVIFCKRNRDSLNQIAELMQVCYASNADVIEIITVI